MSSLPEPPWSSLRGKTTRPPLTRESITDAAMRIVDAEGLEALSMRRLATELGCQASALYGHVSGKAELLQLLLDRAAAEIRLPDPDPDRWQEQLKEMIRAIRTAFMAHGDLAAANFGNVPTGPNILLVADRMLDLLCAGGLSPGAAGYALDLLGEYATVGAYEGHLWRRRHQQEPAFDEELMAYYGALPPERYSTLTSMVQEVVIPDEGPDDRFEFGLAVIVRGLEELGAG